MGRYPSGQREQTVNLPPYGFGGSNPPLPTKQHRSTGTVTSVHKKSGSNSGVESQPSKLLVAGSNPVSRSIPSLVQSWIEAPPVPLPRAVGGSGLWGGQGD